MIEDNVWCECLEKNCKNTYLIHSVFLDLVYIQYTYIYANSI